MSRVGRGGDRALGGGTGRAMGILGGRVNGNGSSKGDDNGHKTFAGMGWGFAMGIVMWLAVVVVVALVWRWWF